MISIIVPIYNVEEYLEECLLSIQNQTYKDFECILVNDGSTDTSPKIAQKFVDNDERFKLIHQKNCGLATTRNKGLEYVTGDFITFVDSDDMLFSNFLEVCLDNMEDDIDIVEARKVIFRSNEELSNINMIVEKPIKSVTYNTTKELVIAVSSYELENRVWSKLFRSSVKDEMKFPDGRIFEDLYVTLHLCKLGYKVKKIDYAGYFYRKRANSIMHSKFTKVDWDLFFICESIEEEYKNVEELHAYIYKILANNILLQFCEKTRFTFKRDTKHKKVIKEYAKRAILNGKYIKLARISPNLVWIIDNFRRKVKTRL